MSGSRRVRAAILKLHRWIAFSAGLVLMLNAITGLSLLFGEPIHELLEPELFSVQPQAAKVSMESIRQSLQTDFDKQNLTLFPPHEANASLQVLVRGTSGWEGTVYVDPYTGSRLGVMDRFNIGFGGLSELHISLLSGSTGKAILGIAALCMFLMLLSGLYMWWPVRWRMAFTINLRTGRLRSLFDLHRVAGATLGLWVMVMVASGGMLAYRPATQWINQIAGAKPMEEAPKVPAQTSNAPPEMLDTLIEQANAALPGGRIGSIILPGNLKQPMRVRTKVDGDPHPYGRSTVWLNARNGDVLRVDHWKTQPPAERMFTWIYPLHSGQLAGAIGFIGTAISGISLLGFGITGTWLWWIRRSKRLAQLAAQGAKQSA
jgi:uncharacterized iron-regulated membrane protein